MMRMKQNELLTTANRKAQSPTSTALASSEPASHQTPTTMNPFTIVCPNCKSKIPLTEAVTHHVQEQLQADFQHRQALLQKSIAEREKIVAEQQAGVEKARLELDSQLAEKLAAERSKLSASALAEAKLSLGVEMQ